jgi:predicted transcriptional regulator
MTAQSEHLEQALLVNRTHAALTLALDDALGTLHGLSWSDFVLLRNLAAAADAVPLADLVVPLGAPASAVLRRVIPLERTGLVQREPGQRVSLRRSGRRLLHEATSTAQAVCAQVMPCVEPA